MASFLSRYLISSRVRKENVNVKRQFMGWPAISRLALVIDQKQINKSQIDNFVQNSGKYIDVYLVETSAKVPSFNDWKSLTRKERTLIGVPNENAYNLVSKDAYDAIIVLTETDPDYCAAIVSSMKASFKCGNRNSYGEVDLIVECKSESSVTDKLSIIRKYLEMIRN